MINIFFLLFLTQQYAVQNINHTIYMNSLTSELIITIFGCQGHRQWQENDKLKKQIFAR